MFLPVYGDLYYFVSANQVFKPGYNWPKFLETANPQEIMYLCKLGSTKLPALGGIFQMINESVFLMSEKSEMLGHFSRTIMTYTYK